jgi:hypothetical protein
MQPKTWVILIIIVLLLFITSTNPFDLLGSMFNSIVKLRQSYHNSGGLPPLHLFIR